MPETDEHHTSLSKLVSRRFINGLILLVPLAITIFVVLETLNFTEGTIVLLRIGHSVILKVVG